jgi:hypothetical protein
MASEPLPPLLARRKVLGGSVEATSGTFITTITAGFAANYYNVKCNPGDFTSEGEREPDGNYMGSVAAVIGKQMGTLEFDMDVAYGGPVLGLLPACGYLLTTGTYAPSSNLATRTTWTFVVWEDGRQKKLAGCAGNVTFDIERGKKVVAHFKFSGIWLTPVTAALPANAPVTALPYVALAITLTMAAAAIANVSKISIDVGAAPEEREAIAGNAQGIAHYLVGEIEPKMTMDPEARKVADQDSYGLFLGGATVAVVVVLNSSTHSLTITAVAAQRTKVSDGARGKRLTDDLDLACRISSGDDALTFTEV